MIAKACLVREKMKLSKNGISRVMDSKLWTYNRRSSSPSKQEVSHLYISLRKKTSKIIGTIPSRLTKHQEAIKAILCMIFRMKKSHSFSQPALMPSKKYLKHMDLAKEDMLWNPRKSQLRSSINGSKDLTTMSISFSTRIPKRSRKFSLLTIMMKELTVASLFTSQETITLILINPRITHPKSYPSSIHTISMLK